MQLQEALRRIKAVDRQAMEQVKRRLDSIIKPLNSLGLLETYLVKIAGMTGCCQFDFSRKATVVFCADNGVVHQGISQSGQEVTAIVTENLATGDTCLCAMSRAVGAAVIPVDIGVSVDLHHPLVWKRKVMYGTNDITREPAMTREQAVQAVEVGISLAGELQKQGYSLLATGEMGIGNTTTSAAVAAALLGISPAQTAGKGAGLSDKGLHRKIQVIERALQLHLPNREEPLDVLAKVGGLDIAGMAGLCIGGAVYGIPIVLDGIISNVAALVACRMDRRVEDFLLPSHCSPEPAAQLILRELGLEAPLHAQMRLGEGTGAVATFPMYDMAAAVYRDMVTFDDESMEAYQPL